MDQNQDFNYSLDEMRKATIVRYLGNADVIAIPSHIVTNEGNYEVVSLSERLFLETLGHIKECWLPNGITSISPAAFANTIIDHLYVRKDSVTENTLKETQYSFTPLSLSLNKREVELLLDGSSNQSYQLLATIAEELEGDFEYVLEDEEVAYCTKEGRIEGRKDGSTFVRLCKKGNRAFCDMCKLIVKQPRLSIYPEQLTINLKYGKEKRITSVVGPTEYLEKEVQYKSSNEKVASVASDGLVTGKMPGSTVITAHATVGEAKLDAHCILLCGELETLEALQILSKDVKDLAICPDEAVLSLSKQESYPLQMKSKSRQKQKKTFSWSAGDEEIVSVDQNGMVTAKGLGVTYVKAETKGGTFWCKVTVV